MRASREQISHDEHRRHWHGLPFETVTPPESLHLEQLIPSESMLWATTSGCADHTWRERATLLRSTIRPGAVAFKLGEHELRDYRTAGRYAGYCMLFPDRQVRALMGEDADRAISGLRGGAGYQTGSDAFVLQVMRTIAADIDTGCPLGPAFAEAVSISILSYLVQLRSPHVSESRPVQDLTRIDRAKDFIEAHLSEELSLANIAAQVHLSPRQLARAFGAAMGCPVHRYILERRISRAKAMLVHQSATVVSMTLGFSTPSHFAQTFRAFMGVTPSEYKQSMARR